MSSTSEPIRHGYSVMRLITDELKGEAVPIGVAAWDAARQWFSVRVLGPDEDLAPVTAKRRKLLEVVATEVGKWARLQQVPYALKSAPPWTGDFWSGVSRIMSTAVRFDMPKAMDPFRSPEEDVEGLYEAVVRPRQRGERRAARVDGALSKALGNLSDVIPNRPVVEAFGHARERVLRGVVRDQIVLLIDAVNLSGHHARQDADAMVSRLRRIKSAYEATRRSVSIIVGYMASPGGLNGESHMCEWIRHEVTRDVYDLTVQEDLFRHAAERVYSEISRAPQTSLIPEMTTSRVRVG